MAELSVHDPLPPEYWESLGMEGNQARPSDPFSNPPPGHGTNPFEDNGGPTGQSRYEASWLTTYRGVEFIDVFVGESPGTTDTHLLVFLYEVIPGHYNVGLSRPKTAAGGRWLHKDQGYEEAKRLAEEEASAMSVDAGAAADWRQDPPGERQLDLITRLGIRVNVEITSKGQASDLLNVFFSSKVLDHAFTKSRS